MQQKWQQKIDEQQADIRKYSQLENMLGIVKVILVIIIIAAGYQWIIQGTAGNSLLIVLTGIIFYGVIGRAHRRALKSLALARSLVKIYQRHMQRLDGSWKDFSDKGADFLEKGHVYGNDLDILGQGSIYQLLCSAHTYYGRKRFAKDLLAAEYNVEQRVLRQLAIVELFEKEQQADLLERCFMDIGLDQRFPQLIEQLKGPQSFLSHSYLIWLFRGMSLFTTGCFITAVLFQSATLFTIGGSMFAVQLIVWFLGFMKTQHYLGNISKMPRKMMSYQVTMEHFLNEEFDSAHMQALQKKVAEGRQAMVALGKISGRIDQCQNYMVWFVLNGLFLWDYNNAYGLDCWKKRYGRDVEGWFEALGEVESLLSFAQLPRACTGVTVPSFTEKSQYLMATHLGHPLIANDSRVCNHFQLNQDICIISGSNMSGKTTFMRTVGINVVLAYAGSYVCAEKMDIAANMTLVTSMRIADDLSLGSSTFYAELLQIKRIIDEARNNSHTLFLIDEIFRGTNSVDRLKGAEGVLLALCQFGVSGIITTHDLEICQLSQQYPSIHNYSFHEMYQEDEIYFDYKVKQGKSTTTNGAFLLKKVGILD